MDNKEYLEFLRSLLIKIENAINLLKQKPSRHIPSYNKMLGVKQKISNLNEDCKNRMFSQMITSNSIITYFMNGRYEEAFAQIIKLKTEIVKICLEIQKRIKNEKNTI